MSEVSPIADAARRRGPDPFISVMTKDGDVTQGRIALWWLILGSGFGLISAVAARGATPGDDTKYANTRNFRVPVAIPPADAPRYKKVILCASKDRGTSWEQIAATTPNRPTFTYSSATDGEVWFAAQSVDQQGRLFPDKTAAITPNMKVIIDTKKPELRFLSQARKGNYASVSWEVKDENLDLDTLSFDFLPAGSDKPVQIPVPRPSLLGKESWDAGTAEPIRVRGMIADKAGNRVTVYANLAGGGLPDDAVSAAVESPSATTPPPMGTLTSSEASRPVSPNPDLTRPDRSAGDGTSGDGGAVSAYDPFSDPNSQQVSGASSRPSSNVETLPPVADPRFSLAYAVDDAGPNGAAVVELYTTRNGGQTWEPRGPDPDRKTPFEVDLGSDGTYGLKLVARSAADQGDKPPVPGEAPQTVVDVDSHGPVVTLDKPRVEGNTLVITWRSEDAHPSPANARSVMISVRSSDAAPNGRYVVITPTALPNTGQFRWQVPPSCPAKIQVRIDIRDDLNNLGSAETPADSPILVDLSKPKSRIIGLDRANPRR